MNNIKQLPAIGDTVVKALLSKDRTKGKIVFDSGKEIVFDIVSGGAVIKPQAKVKHEPEPVQSDLKNTIQDPEYKRNISKILARHGIDVPDVPMSTGMNNPEQPVADVNDIVARAKARAQNLGESISRANGGKLEKEVPDGGLSVSL